ncbi:MAG: helix-turn-helix domain-containing protein [Devosia sp.]
MSLRDDKRRWSMREVQAAALDLFEASGFDAVSVEAIAAAAGVSAPTVYRHFGTKERIIVWDDYDPGLLDTIARHATQLPPLRAVETGLIEELDRVYEADSRRVLRRARLMLATPALRLANVPVLAELRAELGAVLALSYADLTEARADLLAAVILVGLETAIGRWIGTGGKTSLRTHFRDAFADLRSVILTEGALT